MESRRHIDQRKCGCDPLTTEAIKNLFRAVLPVHQHGPLGVSLDPDISSSIEGDGAGPDLHSGELLVGHTAPGQHVRAAWVIEHSQVPGFPWNAREKEERVTLGSFSDFGAFCEEFECLGGFHKSPVNFDI